MTIPRDEKLRITQEVYKQWQEIYGDRNDAEAEAANSLEFHLSKNYFMNLGIIMKEYLATTTLGDLVRKSKEVEAEVASSQSAEASNAGILTSSIRNPIGEINQ